MATKKATTRNIPWPALLALGGVVVLAVLTRVGCSSGLPKPDAGGKGIYYTGPSVPRGPEAMGHRLPQ